MFGKKSGVRYSSPLFLRSEDGAPVQENKHSYPTEQVKPHCFPDIRGIGTPHLPQQIVSGGLLARSIREKGFTLIEVIAVLALIGILTFVVIGQSGNFDADVIGGAEVVKNHLRYSQVKAMNSDVNWGLNFSAGSYVLVDADGNQAPLPGEIPTSISYSPLPSVNPVMFDQRGSPGATTLTITLTKGGSSSTVTVTPNTGFVP
nr:prepilin-type N-terminal cleavage/methylation domain-containing protein [Desulfobulbaceae bacterium]